MASSVSGIPGLSTVLNNLTAGLDDLSSTLLGGLTSSAVTVSSALLANFSTVTSSLRSILPEIPALSNVSLPALMRDLSSIDITPGAIDRIANLTRHGDLLARGKDLFNDAVNTAGFDFDGLVDDALKTFNLDPTLTFSDIIPNIEVDALGIGPAIFLPNNIKFPEVPPAFETARKAFTANSQTLVDHIGTVKAIIEVNLTTTTDEDDPI